MKIRLVSHSSVLIRAADFTVWTDPWLEGKPFNDSWTLFPLPAWDPAWLEEIDAIWISHEHPDHFSIPTLRSLPGPFRERVQILFQADNSDKMEDAFRKLGYPNFRSLPHRQIVEVHPGVTAYCYQIGQMDSSLGLRSGGQTIYNVNDATVTPSDAEIMISEFGAADVVLNQFSIAGFLGGTDRDQVLRGMMQEHLEMMLGNHKDLKARWTIPFASFMIYSSEDNRYMNDYVNRPRDVCDFFSSTGERVALLFPGDEFDASATEWSNEDALARFDDAFSHLDEFEFDPVARVPLEEIAEAFRTRTDDLREKYPRILLSRLQPVTVRIPDLECTVRFAIATGEFERVEGGDAADLVVHSQPLHHTFAFPWGVQTLGVSARGEIHGGVKNWSLHRVLFALYNAEIYLRPRYLFTARNLEFLRQRRRGLIGQARARLAHMAKGF